ncbi:MAG: DUF3299 domain-containing protein [Candidatus Eremiobacteraeota bacterium]|nr:DUF3299 domain-containing protein [Candidatus Eremiobacteraeota bacterium]MCW5869394.1 DUF3299 domain-containing protein [Candidatus Eremiobacteraeota bacterium]
MKKLLLLILFCAGCGQPTEPKTSYRPVTWKQLSSFACPVKAISLPLPSDVQALDGQRVQLSGYMVPLDMDGTRIQSFLLVRDQMLCCFGKMPALNEWVFVEFPKGGGLELQVDRPLQVSGHFRAREEREKGVVMSLYRMQAEKVQVLQNTSQGWKAS